SHAVALRKRWYANCCPIGGRLRGPVRSRPDQRSLDPNRVRTLRSSRSANFRRPESRLYPPKLTICELQATRIAFVPSEVRDLRTSGDPNRVCYPPKFTICELRATQIALVILRSSRFANFGRPKSRL